MLYLLDANTLIDAKRNYYQIDRVPEFWEWLIYRGRQKTIKIPLEIYEEFSDSKDTAKEKPIEGKVVAAGNGRVGDDGKLIPLEVKKGDRVLFGKYGGTEVKMDGEEYLIMREDDILGIIE